METKLPSTDSASQWAVVSDKQLGDVVLLEPLTRLIADRTGSKCALFVKESFEPLVSLMPHATWGPASSVPVDLSITTSWSSRVVLQSRKISARRRRLLVNQSRHLRWWYRFLFSEIRVEPIGGEYWGHYFWRVHGGVDEAFVSSCLNLPPETWRHPELLVEPYVLINPTAAWPVKYWTAEGWAALMHASKHANLRWVMTGGVSEPEKAHCSEIKSRAGMGARMIDLVGITSLKEYLHAISRASMVVCVDGSASHLAQAFGVPALTLFGPVYPVKWHWPTPRHVALSAFDHVKGRVPSSADLPSDAVLSAFEKLAASVLPGVAG